MSNCAFWGPIHSRHSTDNFTGTEKSPSQCLINAKDLAWSHGRPFKLNLITTCELDHKLLTYKGGQDSNLLTLYTPSPWFVTNLWVGKNKNFLNYSGGKRILKILVSWKPKETCIRTKPNTTYTTVSRENHLR